jgi:hypothetical protein
MTTSSSDAVARLVHHYFFGWQESNWEWLRETLAPDVIFEDPRLGRDVRVVGIDAHMALYVENKRFPELSGVALRAVANSEDVAFVSYDVYLGTRRTITVMDQLSARDGKIARVFSVSSEWPPYPDSR